MSRIGLKVIKLPEGVTLEKKGEIMSVKGPKGSLDVVIPSLIEVKVADGEVSCSRANEEKHTKQLHGTTRANLNDAIVGVTKGFKKEIVIVGIGYRAAMRGDSIVMNVGYSHEIVIKPEPNSKISCKSATEIVVEGISKQAVGQTAALIRGTREPEPYNGKGVMYKGEHIIRKEGKRAGGTAKA
jgi:large subunit ribosomal protein L6